MTFPHKSWFFTALLVMTAVAAMGSTMVIHEANEGTERYSLLVGPAEDGPPEAVEIDAEIHRTVVKVDDVGSTAELLNMFWSPLNMLGYSELFRCRAADCGGYLFRRALDLAPFPQMYLNIADYRYLSAVSQNGPADGYVSLLASRTDGAGYVQVVTLGRDLPRQTLLSATNSGEDGRSLAESIAQEGHASLKGLKFAQGSGELVEDEYPSLAELAIWLVENPEAHIALVGHTDNKGDLKHNVGLSLARANTVLDYIRRVYGVDDRRITTHGIGYLSPRTTNQTDDGRADNRRVEVILVPRP